MRIALTLTLLALATAPASAATKQVPHISLQRGLVLVSAVRADQGDRENVVTIEEQTANGITHGWTTRVLSADGKPQDLEFRRHVRAVDLEKATRLHFAYWTGDKADYPGYTGLSVSSAVYDVLARNGEAPYMIVMSDSAGQGPQAIIGGLLRKTQRLKGTLRQVSKAPVDFPVLYNGTRINVPALHAGGRFADSSTAEDVELWILAERGNPLLLKTIMGKEVWQLVRIETPRDPPGRTLEQQLTRNCRVELPGIYFEFASAELDSRSDRSLVALAEVLTTHPDWSVSIEGHTDNVGSDASNAKLSQARADAVRTSLVQRHSIAAARMKTSGFGEARPRESNETLEGRARNRRVELVRPCAAGS